MLVIVSIDLIIIAIGSAIPQSRLIATRIRDTQHPEATTVCHVTEKSLAKLLIKLTNLLILLLDSLSISTLICLTFNCIKG